MDAIAGAPSIRTRALARYRLAVFHDNHSREADAIPLYQAAIRDGLPSRLNAEAHAWLASSLYKTGKLNSALREVSHAREVTRSRELRKFLDGLETRIIRRLALSTTRQLQ